MRLSVRDPCTSRMGLPATSAMPSCSSRPAQQHQQPLRATCAPRRQVCVQARSSRGERRKPPPPDLPSLLFDQRIVYLGMPLVPAVTELMVAELLYLEKQGNSLPIEMMINSSGTTRQDGEILAFDSEGIALCSAMGFIKNPISTINMGLAVGWAAVVLSFGKKGWRKSLPHSLAMIQQPKVPPTGQRQAVEVHIKWREVLDYKKELLRMLSIGTGWTVDKLDKDMQRPLYMRPVDALEYGIIDEIIEPDEAKAEKARQYWARSGRSESDGRLEEWLEYITLQEQGALRDSFKKVQAQELRDSYRKVGTALLGGSKTDLAAQEDLKRRLLAQDPDLMTADGQVRLPFNKEGLRIALLNAERFSHKNVQRQVDAGTVKVPQHWKEDAKEVAATWGAPEKVEVDYAALMQRIDAMSPETFQEMDIDAMLEQCSKVTA